MDLFFQSLGEANKEEKGNAKKKAKVEKKDWTRRGDEVLLKRGLVVPRSRKMWKTTFRLKQLKRMGLLRGSVGMKKTGTGRCCGSRQGTSSDSFRRGLGNLTCVLGATSWRMLQLNVYSFTLSYFHTITLCIILHFSIQCYLNNFVRMRFGSRFAEEKVEELEELVARLERVTCS